MADIPGNNTTTATISVGGSTTNSLEVSGDHDWFKINLTAGQAITVTLNGVTLEDPYLTIRDASGNILYENDDVNTGVNLDSAISFAANYTGVYYIDVGSFETAEVPGGTGDYQLNVTTWTQPPVWTNDQIADQLTEGYWGDGTHQFVLDSSKTITVNVEGLDFFGKDLALTALQQWSSITGITFVQTSSTAAQITFTDDDPDGGAFTESTYSGSGDITSSHVNIDASWLSDYGDSVGSYTYQAYVHEIGHALGLGHAGNYNTTATYPYDALSQNDAWVTSVMSYFSQTENTYFAGQGFDDAYLVTPMVADILAIGQLYGLSNTTRSGDTTYGFNSNAGNPYNAAVLFNVALTIFDTGGIDTMDYSGFDDAQRIDLNSEAFSNIGGLVGNVSIARGTVIENAIGGGGNDVLIGNSVKNILNGGLGADVMKGGAANDTYYVDNIGDQAIEYSAAGSDTIYSSVSFTLAANVENLRLTGSSAINATGNSSANLLTGNTAANILNGGGGADKMAGGAGNDTYYVDNAGDQVIEYASSGSDSVNSTISYVLSYNLENLKLLGSASIDATGNARNNVLIGNSGANILNGGAGSDKMGGGTGNDTYYVDNVGDQVIENASSGTDTVYSAITYVLGQNVETLRLIGWQSVNATGNELNNVIAGNTGNNTLQGGAGDDKLWGGKGADQLWGGSGADEFAFGGTDFGGFTASNAERIHDFSQTEGDFLNFQQMDANTLLDGRQGFTFIGDENFHGVAGELRYVNTAANTYLYGDTNGDGTADFLILIDGVHTLTTGDFIF